MKRKWIAGLMLLCLSVLPVFMLSGCEQLQKPGQTEKQTEKATEKPAETEKKTEKATEKITEKATEAAPVENVVYISKDKSIRIVLPDSTWKVTQDADEMRVFSSDAAMINIVHAKTESELKRLAVAESLDELQNSLSRQYPEANAFEIEDFEHLSVKELNSYQYIVKYSSKSMWAYAVTFGILAKEEAYVVTGTVMDDNRALLDAVVESVTSFAVLENEVFDLTEPETTETVQSETSATGDEEANKQLANLTVYTETTLYAADEVNIRKEPSTNADILGSLTKGDKVTVTGETSEWFRVSINGQTAYISKQFLVYGDGQNGSQETGAENTDADTQQTSAPQDSMVSAEVGSEIDYGSGYTYYTTSDVNMRANPGTDADVLDSLAQGASVQVVGETDNWYVVSVNGQKAYVSKSYLSSEAPSSSDGSGSSSQSDIVVDDGDSSGLSISGTVTSATDGVMVVAGDDGNTYAVSYSPDAVNAADGIYEGLYISATVADAGNGTYTASSVTGY